jgi:hypothetical protein
MRKPWGIKEDRQLETLWSDGYCPKQIAELMDRSVDSVNWRRRFIGLPGIRQKAKRTRSREIKKRMIEAEIKEKEEMAELLKKLNEIEKNLRHEKKARHYGSQLKPIPELDEDTAWIEEQKRDKLEREAQRAARARV